MSPKELPTILSEETNEGITLHFEFYVPQRPTVPGHQRSNSDKGEFLGIIIESFNLIIYTGEYSMQEGGDLAEGLPVDLSAIGPLIISDVRNKGSFITILTL